MTDQKEKKKCIDWPTALCFFVGITIGNAIMAIRAKTQFEEAKAAIMAKDIPPLEKCLQMLQLLEPK